MLCDLLAGFTFLCQLHPAWISLSWQNDGSVSKLLFLFLFFIIRCTRNRQIDFQYKFNYFTWHTTAHLKDCVIQPLLLSQTNWAFTISPSAGGGGDVHPTEVSRLIQNERRRILNSEVWVLLGSGERVAYWVGNQ